MANLLENFYQSLPFLPTKTGSTVQNKASSTTVERETPPHLLISDNSGSYLTYADNFLSLYKDQLSKRSGLSFENGILRNEEDVVQYSRMYLISPIIQALQMAYPKLVLTLATEYGLSTLRVDMACVIEVKGTDKVVMMVEFKRSGYIRLDEIEQAMWHESELNSDHTKPTIPDPLKKLVNNTQTMYQIKQATAYARRSKSLYAVLCDYDSMVLLKFNDKLDIVRVTSVEPKAFRRALLGFVVKALSDADAL